MDILLVDISGWIGMALILLAYILLEMDKIEEETITYNGLNIVGGLTLLVNTVYYKAYPAAGLNIAWAIIGVYGIMRGMKIFKR